ncbi:MAG TPA: C40 family peptidase [Chloroflexota bacterium]
MATAVHSLSPTRLLVKSARSTRTVRAFGVRAVLTGLALVLAALSAPGVAAQGLSKPISRALKHSDRALAGPGAVEVAGVAALDDKTESYPADPDPTDRDDRSADGNTVGFGSGESVVSEGDEIAAIALQYQGARYRWGGAGPSGFDCSGFVYYVLWQAGDPVPRDHYGQISAGIHVNRPDLEPGDMVFFRNTYEPGLSHSGIYVGGDQFIHAGTPTSGVVVSSLTDPYWSGHWAGATRAWAA